ncbi:hypothetical protein [Paenibacillus sp. UNC499MF]|nr:hypothetical protein [Paenibacillus sp. UNC499MF]
MIIPSSLLGYITNGDFKGSVSKLVPGRKLNFVTLRLRKRA